MILPGNASVIISAARYLVKLGGRFDSIAAERTAVESDLILKLPAFAVVKLTDSIDLADAELQRTAGLDPDPFSTDRDTLKAEVGAARQGRQPTAAFGPLFAKYFPDTALLADPDQAYLGKLRAAFPGVDWRDPGARIAAFAIGAGSNSNQIGYNTRMALAVADTLLEFGADNAAEFVRNEKLRGIAATVLQRLAEPEWDSFTQWGPLVQSALRSALNAALDVAELDPAGNPWFDGVLQSLCDARKAAPNPDDFLLGLLHGDGFRLLLGRGLLVASDRLDDAQADAFRLVAADVLKAAAPLVQEPARSDFRQFFNDHWGDLLRAGLTSVDRHGQLILGGADPLLKKVLQTMVRQLSQIPDARFLSSETVFRLADAAIGVVADNITTQPGLQDQPWLRDFLAAAAASARTLTARKLFTRQAAEALLLDAVGALAKHPDLLVSSPGLPQDIVKAVLGGVGSLKSPDARLIGETALRAAFGAVARDPALAAKPFGAALAAVATTLSGMVGQKGLAAADAATLAEVAIEATLRNPVLFARASDDVASTVLRAVHAVLPDTPEQPWAGRMFATLTARILLVFARSGSAMVATRNATALQQWVVDVLDAGLKRAAGSLGNNIDLEGVPEVLAGLVDRALRGDLTLFDPANGDFQRAFDELATSLALKPAT